MPDTLNRDAPILGPVPDCSTQTDVRAAKAIARVNEPLTLTMRVRVSCPELMDSRRVVLVLGGLPSDPWVQDARVALRRIVRTFASGTDNRMTIIDVAAPAAPAEWASSAADFDTLADEMLHIKPRPELTKDAWLTALSTAERRLSEIDVRRQPFFIVFDAAGAAGAASDQTAIRTQVARLGFRARDAVGHVVLFDLTPDGRLFLPLAEGGSVDAPFVTVFSGAYHPVDKLAGWTLAAFDAPMEYVQVLLFSGGRILPFTCTPMDVFPPASLDSTGDPTWMPQVTGHSAELEFVAVLRIEKLMPPQDVLALVAVLRAGVNPLGSITKFIATSTMSICAAPAAPAPLTCPPPPERTPAPLPPGHCPRPNRIWLPYFSAHPAL